MSVLEKPRRRPLTLARAKLDPAEALSLASQHALLASIPRPVLQQVIGASRLIHHRANRTWLTSGDPADHVYCLLKGSVRVFYRDPFGGSGELLVKLFRAPALLCEMEVLSAIPVLPNARTLEPCDILYLPAELFWRLVRTEPTFAKVLVLDLARRLCVSEDQQRAIAFADVSRRLANLLLDYARLCGIAQGDELKIPIPLNQRRMASDLGVSRKSVYQALARLKEDGIVTKQAGRYVITDLAALAARSSQRFALMHRIGTKLESV